MEIKEQILLKDKDGNITSVKVEERDAFFDMEELTEAELAQYNDKRELAYLRSERAECFSYVNRGKLWYNTLTDEQITQLQEWYQAWLDVTDTRKIPNKPDWLT